MQSFNYVRAATLEEASRLLQENPDAKVMAGGIALIIMMKNRILLPETVIDIKGVSGIDRIERREGGLRIGALVTHRALETSALIKRYQPMITAMERDVASVQVRNKGTIGGNLCHAEPASDPPPVLIALDASLTIVGPAGRREIPAADFILNYYETALGQQELLESISIPDLAPNTGTAYVRFVRSAMDRSVVSVAARITLDSKDSRCTDARVVIGNCDGRHRRAPAAERMLIGERLSESVVARAAQVVDKGLSPISDLRASADYRRHLARITAGDAIRSAVHAVTERVG